MTDVTRILFEINSGDRQASEKLLPIVYDELRRLAAARMTGERPDHTLGATALVHEVYLRLVDTESARDWDGRAHFFAAAAEAMRRILVESARRRKTRKRGGDQKRVELADDLVAAIADSPTDLVDFNDALERLSQDDEQVAQLVKLRLFGGLSLTEASQLLGLPTSTAQDQWDYARAWFAYRLRDDR